MKILSIKPVEKTFAVECHSIEDFVFVSGLIQENDLVTGETDRNIKPREVGQKPFRIKMFLTIKVNEWSVDENTSSFRVSGIIEKGSPAEFVEMHAQHALVFNLFQPINVEKQNWYAHDVERLRAREKESQRPLYLGIVLDDEEANILQVSGAGLKELGKIHSFKSGKQYKSEGKANEYFTKLFEIIYASPLETVIIAGPGFTREELVRYLKENAPKGKAKTLLSVPTSSIGEKGIREALSSDSITKALGEFSQAKDAELMSEVLKHLGKDDGLVSYGFSHVERSVKSGAAHTLLISSSYLSENKEKVHALLNLAHQQGVSSRILEEKFDPGKQLSGLSGVAALLRYRVDFT